MVAKKKRDWLEPPEWWKKFRPLRLAVIGLLGYGVYSWLDLGQQAVVALQKPHEATVSYTAVLANPVDLITPLHSYSSVADVEAVLKQGEYGWRKSEIRTAATPDHPPRNLDTLVINGYQHLGVVGELTLAYEELAVTADPGTILMIYTAEPGSPSASACNCWPPTPPARSPSSDRRRSAHSAVERHAPC